MGSVVRVENLTTQVAHHILHEDLNFQVYEGEIFSLVGGSGSGKSVLLKVLLGLMPKKKGTIFFWDRPMKESKDQEILYEKVGVMFQSGALFSSLTVLENLCLPLKEKAGLSLIMAQKLAFMRLEMVGLSRETGFKRPGELSGGMIKRVALARALILDAQLLFLDEPTAGLDPIAAEGFDSLLKTLQTHLALTVIMITHDLDTLHATSNRVGVLVDKKMITGTLEEIIAYDHPWIHQYFLGPRGRVFLERT
jgi:phospholipid/cholesterol/gamma-HCH transport system ATP-binding protein